MAKKIKISNRCNPKSELQSSTITALPQINFSPYRLFACVGLVCSILVIYVQTFDFGFINYDDDKIIYENAVVMHGLTWGGIKSAFFEPVVFWGWYPITALTHMLDFQLFGLSPTPYHILNVLFHIFNSLLLFFVLQRMTGRFWCSFTVVTLFAIHPLNVEVVAWASQRKTLLAAFFFLLTLISYHRYTLDKKSATYWLSVALFILSLLAKPMMVPLPVMLLLLDFWPLHRINTIPFKQLLVDKIPFLAVALIVSYITLYIGEMHQDIMSVRSVDWPTRIQSSIIGYITYPKAMLWPHNMGVLYPFKDSFSAASISIALSLLTITTFIVWRLRKALPFCIVGWLWYLVSLIPMNNLFNPGQHAWADRYGYVTLIGLFVGMVWSFASILERVPQWKKASVSIFAALMTAFIVISYSQAAIWKDSTTLFEHSLKACGPSAVLHNNLAIEYAKGSNLKKAFYHSQEAVQLGGTPSVLLNLGLFYRQAGNREQSLIHFKQAILMHPDYPMPYIYLGIDSYEQKNYLQALKYYKKGLELSKKSRDDRTASLVHYNIGCLFAEERKTDEALYNFQQSIHYNPLNAESHFSLGLVFRDLNKLNDAMIQFRLAINCKPNFAEAHNNVAILCDMHGNVSEAIEHFREALRINPKYLPAQENLNELLQRQNRR